MAEEQKYKWMFWLMIGDIKGVQVTPGTAKQHMGILIASIPVMIPIVASRESQDEIYSRADCSLLIYS